jgi:hypothetical protein
MTALVLSVILASIIIQLSRRLRAVSGLPLQPPVAGGNHRTGFAVHSS